MANGNNKSFISRILNSALPYRQKFRHCIASPKGAVQLANSALRCAT